MVMNPQGSTGRGGAPHHQWRKILWSCRDTFRVQIGRLLVHTLSPTLPLSDRKGALEFVLDSRHLDILKESLSPSLEVTYRCSTLTVALCVISATFREKQTWDRMYLQSYRKAFRRLPVFPSKLGDTKISAYTLVFVSSAQHGPKLSLYLYEMMHDHKDSLSKDQQNAISVFVTSLKLCGHRCIPPNAAHKPDLLKAIKEVRTRVFFFVKTCWNRFFTE